MINEQMLQQIVHYAHAVYVSTYALYPLLIYLQVDEIIAKTKAPFPIFSDPDHKLRNYLSEQELLQVVVSGGEKSKNEFYKNFKFFLPYKNGVAQPALMFITRDGEVAYAWAVQPAAMNWHGAIERPNPEEVWAKVNDYLGKKTEQQST